MNRNIWIYNEKYKNEVKDPYPWIKAIEIDGNIRYINNNDFKISEENLLKVETTKICNNNILDRNVEENYEIVDDISSLDHLNEPSLIDVLEKKYIKYKQIYMKAGNSILLAINPFCDHIHKENDKDFYEPEIFYNKLKNINKIVNDSYADKNEINKKMKKDNVIPPHVFGIADIAYRSLVNKRKNQSILISGETGAGKTESAKYIIKYLEFLSEIENSNYLNRTSINDTNVKREKILEASTILFESFGNAKTLHNDNSSRFGKFMKIIYNIDEYTGLTKLINTEISTYLLEKTRVVKQSKGERNFHIFYEIFNSNHSMNKFFLKNRSPTDYNYINIENTYYPIHKLNENSTFEKILISFHFLGFSNEDIDGILSIISAILHIGNIKFKEKQDSHLNGFLDLCIIDDIDDSLLKACSLLHILPDSLKSILLKREMFTKNETYYLYNTIKKANNTRDAIARTLYENLFKYLVSQINIKLSFLFDQKYDTKKELIEKKFNFIGVLDIFGFEIFNINRFEQLCINYANEHLQRLFILFTLEIEKKIYEEENITLWKESKINFNSDRIYSTNELLIDLIENKKNGIFSLLDEECMVPKGTDSNFVRKLYSNIISFHNNNSISASKIEQSKLMFTIRHYAGNVTYSTQGFCEKNNDSNDNNDILDLFLSSSSPVINKIISFLPNKTNKTNDTIVTFERRRFSVDNVQIVSNDKISTERNSFTCIDSHSSFNSSINNSKSNKIINLRRRRSSIIKKGLGSQFKNQLSTLLNIIKDTEPHFIRCFKPNDEMKPFYFNKCRIAGQLKCSGITEAIKIIRMTYPIRYSITDFIKEFCILFNCTNYNIIINDYSLLENEIIKILKYENKLVKDHFIHIQNNKRTLFSIGIEIGLTKIFMKNDIYNFFHNLKNKKITFFIIKIQNFWKMWNTKRKYYHIKEKISKIRKIYLKYINKKKKMILRYNSILIIQQFVRKYLLLLKSKEKLKKIKAIGVIRTFLLKKINTKKICQQSLQNKSKNVNKNNNIMKVIPHAIRYSHSKEINRNFILSPNNQNIIEQNSTKYFLPNTPPNSLSSNLMENEYYTLSNYNYNNNFILSLLPPLPAQNITKHFSSFILHIAILEDNLASAEVLLEQGMDVNEKDNYGRTPLHYLKSIELCNLLLLKKPDPLIKDDNGRTALHFAVDIGKPEITLKMLKYGYSMTDTEYENNFTPLHLAVRYGKKDIVGVFCRPDLFDINVLNKVDFYERTCLHSCILCSHVDSIIIMEILLTVGANPNARISNGKTCLHLAILHKGNTAVGLYMVKLLLRFGADPRMVSFNSHTPLSLAKVKNYDILVAEMMRKM